MPTFTAVLRKQVRSSASTYSTSDVFIEYRLEVPALPPVGTEIRTEPVSRSDEGAWNSETVTELAYDARRKRYILHVEPDKTLYFEAIDLLNSGGRPSKKRMQETLAPYLKAGWVVSS